MIIVVMGVAGSGKTTIGARLAAALDCEFLDADSLHSRQNVERMRRGIPLTDADRAPWLVAIHARLLEAVQIGRCLVVACSALKESYRMILGRGVEIDWVLLRGSADLIRSRLEGRPAHFLNVDMLSGQLEILEEPRDAVIVDVARPVDAILEQILAELHRNHGERERDTP